MDVGNGFTTILPTIVFAVCMSLPLLSPRTCGVVGLLMFYQEMYGTIIYFLSYMLNRRYCSHPPWHLYLVVFANSLWILLPLLGLYCSLSLIYTDTYTVFGCLH